MASKEQRLRLKMAAGIKLNAAGEFDEGPQTF
jgi:hypothetical protein